MHSRAYLPIVAMFRCPYVVDVEVVVVVAVDVIVIDVITVDVVVAVIAVDVIFGVDVVVVIVDDVVVTVDFDDAFVHIDVVVLVDVVAVVVVVAVIVIVDGCGKCRRNGHVRNELKTRSRILIVKILVTFSGFCFSIHICVFFSTTAIPISELM